MSHTNTLDALVQVSSKPYNLFNYVNEVKHTGAAHIERGNFLLRSRPSLSLSHLCIHICRCIYKCCASCAHLYDRWSVAWLIKASSKTGIVVFLHSARSRLHLAWVSRKNRMRAPEKCLDQKCTPIFLSSYMRFPNILIESNEKWISLHLFYGFYESHVGQLVWRRKKRN